MGQLSKYLLLPLFVASIFFLSWYPEQHEFTFIFLGFTFAFILYGLLISKKILFENSFQTLLFLGLGARMALLPMFPNLSDDIYRFFWDGMLLHQGINPYSVLPSAIVDTLESDQMRIAFDEMNSQSYFTIYPPIAQLIFYTGTFAKTIKGFSIILKLIFIVFELFTVYFLLRLCQRFNLHKENVFFYFLNPLVIVEGVGNLHFETVMLSFFIGALYFLSIIRLWSFVTLFVLAVATKLVPLLFGPILFIKHLKLKDTFRALIYGAILTVLIFFPVYFGLQYGNFAESLDLYFRKFEFNASLYYILRKVGFWMFGYNTIQTAGPLLAIVSFLSILYLSFKPKMLKLETILHTCIWIVSIYLFTATTVHPWYLMTLLLLGVFKPYKYIAVWSYLVVLSYYTYSNTKFEENMALISIEYFIVFALIIIAFIMPNKALVQMKKV